MAGRTSLLLLRLAEITTDSQLEKCFDENPDRFNLARPTGKHQQRDRILFGRACCPLSLYFVMSQQELFLRLQREARRLSIQIATRYPRRKRPRGAFSGMKMRTRPLRARSRSQALLGKSSMASITSADMVCKRIRPRIRSRLR